MVCLPVLKAVLIPDILTHGGGVRTRSYLVFPSEVGYLSEHESHRLVNTYPIIEWNGIHVILGNDDASMMTVRKQKATREEVQFPWKENRAGQSWRAGSWGPSSNVLLVGMRVITQNSVCTASVIWFLFWALCSGKPMYYRTLLEFQR